LKSIRKIPRQWNQLHLISTKANYDVPKSVVFRSARNDSDKSTGDGPGLPAISEKSFSAGTTNGPSPSPLGSYKQVCFIDEDDRNQKKRPARTSGKSIRFVVSSGPMSDSPSRKSECEEFDNPSSSKGGDDRDIMEDDEFVLAPDEQVEDTIDIEALAKKKLMKVNSAYDGFVFRIDSTDDIPSESARASFSISSFLRRSRVQAYEETPESPHGDDINGMTQLCSSFSNSQCLHC
jgi:hypothetical protein